MELTQRHIEIARSFGACREEVQKLRPGQSVFKLDQSLLWWVMENLPAQLVEREGLDASLLPLMSETGYGDGDGYGYGYGYGSGSGYGDGDGYGDGSSYGSGDGDGYGSGDGDGYGYGYGYGYGSGDGSSSGLVPGGGAI